MNDKAKKAHEEFMAINDKISPFGGDNNIQGRIYCLEFALFGEVKDSIYIEDVGITAEKQLDYFENIIQCVKSRLNRLEGAAIRNIAKEGRITDYKVLLAISMILLLIVSLRCFLW